MDKNGNNIKYVRWYVFVWAIGILTVILFSSIGVSMNAKSDVAEVQGEVKGIQRDISWIRGSLDRIENNLK